MSGSKTKLYYCAGLPAKGASPAVTYGYSPRPEDAHAALERAKKRGVAWGAVWSRKSAPAGLRSNQWPTPFDPVHRAGFS